MKHFKLLLIFLVILIAFSCSNDDDCDIHTNRDLVAIVKEYYINNNLEATEKLNFYKNRLIYIQYSDGSYDDIYYEENLISRILEFDTNNEWEWTTEFNFDSSGRVIDKKVIPSPNNPITTSRHKEISYNGNTINSTLTWSNGPVMRNVYSLNSEGLITEKEYLELNEQTTSFEYTNGDLTKLINKSVNGDIQREITFEYMDKSPSEAYFYNSYLFGEHWNNNLYIQEQFTPTYIELSKIGGRYIKEYYEDDVLMGVSNDVTFAYEFDSNGAITKQTQNIRSSNGRSLKRVYTWVYE